MRRGGLDPAGRLQGNRGEAEDPLPGGSPSFRQGGDCGGGSPSFRQGGDCGVSKNTGVPYFGVRIMRILLFILGTALGFPIFGNPHWGRREELGWGYFAGWGEGRDLGEGFGGEDSLSSLAIRSLTQLI